MTPPPGLIARAAAAAAVAGGGEETLVKPVTRESKPELFEFTLTASTSTEI